MKLKIIGSSSSGNCYVLQPTTGKALILEAGRPIDELGKTIKYKWDQVAGVLLTHEHGDHAGHVEAFQSRGLDVYATRDTALALVNLDIKYIDANPQFKLGDFTVRWFDVNHDASHPVGYLIHHPEMGKLLFITDTAEIPYRFKGVNHLLLEANYDDRHPHFNDLSKSYMQRVRLSHLSIKQACDFIGSNEHDKLATITLCHVSSRNATKHGVKEEVKNLCEHLAIAPAVNVATPWLVIDLPQYEHPNF